jgi:hypothetical protein
LGLAQMNSVFGAIEHPSAIAVIRCRKDRDVAFRVRLKRTRSRAPSRGIKWLIIERA